LHRVTVQTTLLQKQLKLLNQFLKPDNESLSTYLRWNE
jgi:hypothetical protein